MLGSSPSAVLRSASAAPIRSRWHSPYVLVKRLPSSFAACTDAADTLMLSTSDVSCPRAVVMSDATAAETLATPTPCALTLLRCLVVLDSATLAGGRMVADEAPSCSPPACDAPEEDAVSFAADADEGGEAG